MSGALYSTRMMSISQCNISYCTERQTLWHRQIRKWQSISISSSDERKMLVSAKLTHLSRWRGPAQLVAVIIVLRRARLMGVATNSSLIASTKLITGQQWTKNQRKYTAATIITELCWKKQKILSLQHWFYHPYFVDNVSQTLNFSCCFSCDELTLLSKQNILWQTKTI